MTSSFAKMAVRWCRMVVSLMAKRSAICLLRKPTVSPAKNSLVRFVSIPCVAHPVLRRHCQEAKRGQPGGPRITRNCAAIGLLLLPCAITELSLIAMWCLIGATPRGQPWTPAVTLPHGCDVLSERRMAVLWTFRTPSLGRHVHRELLRNTGLDFPHTIPTTDCYQRNYVARYSRSIHDQNYFVTSIPLQRHFSRNPEVALSSKTLRNR